MSTTRDCTWSAAPGVSWIQLTGSTSGQGDGTVNFSVMPNGDPSARTGGITVNGQTFTVSQQPAPCRFTVSPLTANAAAAGGTISIAVGSSAGCNWSATSNAGWITVRSGASGSANGTVQLLVAANAGPDRSGTVSVADQTVTVNQAGSSTQPPPPPPPPSCSFTISPTSHAFSSSGGNGTISVKTTSGCAWTATSNALWVTITSGAAGSGNGSVGYAVAPNTDVARSTTITIADQTFSITQDAAPAPPPPPACTYSVSPTNFRVGTGGGDETVTVTTPGTCAWTATSNVLWIAITAGAVGAGNGTVAFTVAPNGGGGRNGTLTVAGQTVTVSQKGNDPVPVAGSVSDDSLLPTVVTFTK